MVTVMTDEDNMSFSDSLDEEFGTQKKCLCIELTLMKCWTKNYHRHYGTHN